MGQFSSSSDCIFFFSINKSSNKALPRGVWLRVAQPVRAFEVKAYQGSVCVSTNKQKKKKKPATFSILLNDCFDKKQICLCS